MSDPFSTVLGNMERLAREGKITRPPGGFTSKIMKQIRNTSRGELPFLKAIPVRLLVDMANKGTDSRHNSGPKMFKAGETVYVKRQGNGFLYIVPFEMAGSGFEMCKDAVEGKHYEFI
jgi:hypothetical protein